MIKLEITGNDPAAFYSEAMNTLLLLANGGNAMFRPAEPGAQPTSAPLAPVVERPCDTEEAVPEPNPSVLEPPKPRGRPKKADPTTIELKAEPKVENDSLPDFMQADKPDEDPLGLAPAQPEESLTLDHMRDRVKAIVAAHKDRSAAAGTAEKDIMPACIAYVRKLFEPFKIKLAAELKEDQFSKFWSESQKYLEGTAK